MSFSYEMEEQTTAIITGEGGVPIGTAQFPISVYRYPVSYVSEGGMVIGRWCGLEAIRSSHKGVGSYV